MQLTLFHNWRYKMELLITSKTNQQFVYLLNIMYMLLPNGKYFFVCLEFSSWVLNLAWIYISGSLISRFFTIRFPLGSTIVHLTRGQDVELISRRTKLRFGWTLSSTAESNVEYNARNGFTVERWNVAFLVPTMSVFYWLVIWRNFKGGHL